MHPLQRFLVVAIATFAVVAAVRLNDDDNRTMTALSSIWRLQSYWNGEGTRKEHENMLDL
jgi:hypothetical protein